MAMEGPAREAKHSVLISKMQEICCALDRLEELANRIDPLPPQPASPKLTQATGMAIPTLAMFLNNSSSALMEIRDRLDRATNRIQESIF